MTTIAYRSCTLAADSLGVDDSSSLKSTVSKLFKLSNCIVGFAGDTGSGHKFVKWVDAGMPDKRPTFPKKCDFDAVVVYRDRAEVWDEDMMAVPIEDEFYAIGTGAGVAMGAMDMGADAARAVEAATRWDANTGGKIISYSAADLD